MAFFRRASAVVMISGLGLSLFACSSDDPSYGEIAVWDIPSEADITAETQSFEIEATRVECASGETGEIVDVDIESAENENIGLRITNPWNAAQ